MDEKDASALRLALRGLPRTPLGSLPTAPDLLSSTATPQVTRELIKVRGRVTVAGTLMPAPISGRACAAALVEARLVQRHEGVPPWGPLATLWGQAIETPLPVATLAGDLRLADDSGRARVDLSDARLSLLGTWRRAPALRHQDFVAARTARELDVWTDLEYRELVILPGEILTVYGVPLAEADPDPTADEAAPFRTLHGRCLFAASAASPLYVVQERVRAFDALS